MNVTVVMVPYDHDVARWGCAGGPQALIDAGIEDRVRAIGHVVADRVEIALPRSERTRDTVTNLGRIGARVSAAVARALDDDDGYALVLAGNCPHAVGAVGGIAQAGAQPGIVWFDAHGDLHTYATTETGFVGGMPFAVCLGWDLDDWREACGLTPAVRPGAAALIGASDLDPAEVDALTGQSIARLAADRLDPKGYETHRLLAPLADAADSWYLHLDVDVVGMEVPGATTPSDRPAKGRHVVESLRAATATLPFRVATIATYNPGGDPKRRGIPFILSGVEAILENAASR